MSAARKNCSIRRQSSLVSTSSSSWASNQLLTEVRGFLRPNPLKAGVIYGSGTNDASHITDGLPRELRLTPVARRSGTDSRARRDELHPRRAPPARQFQKK